MGDENPMRTLGDYSKPSHEGYRNTIELPTGNNVLRDLNAKESWALSEDLALYDNKIWNDPRDFANPVKEIALPQDVSSTSDHLEQAFIDYASSCTDEAGAGSENRPPMLNKENYVPCSSRLLRYAKSRPNGKLIHNSIINGPYVRRMIPEPGDTNREVLVNETFHVQTDDELKHIEADDQAIQTILLGLPEDIYAAVDSCETAQEIWFTSNDGNRLSLLSSFLKLMNDLKRNKHFPEKIASNLKFLNNLQPEWSQHVTIVHQTKDLHTSDYTQLYDFLKYNQKEVDELKAERLAKTQDPLALMATSNNPYTFSRISLNPRNRQIAQPGMNMGQDRHMLMVAGNGENKFRQYAEQNVGNLNGYNDVQNVRNQVIKNATQNPRVQNVGNHNGLIGVPGNANQNLNGNGNLVAVRTEAANLDEIEEVNANCILMANLQQASTSGLRLQRKENVQLCPFILNNKKFTSSRS
nr:hypothetical protein [Tanacetum cinerariifolium]